MRRGVLAMVVVAGLLLMHGGVGQAAACGPAMLAMPMDVSSDATTMSDSSAAGSHDIGHQPADQPMKAHSTTMCVSAALSDGVDGKNAGTGASQIAAAADIVLPSQGLLAFSGRTGWHPPGPDPISELCVIRQ